MLSDRIITVLDRMHVTISDVARAGGCTPSNLNRIKNGVRVPAPSSPTIRYLTNGLIEIARQRNLSGELASLCGGKLHDSEDVLGAKLIQWLYEDTPAPIRPYRKHKNAANVENPSESWTPTEFSRRLDLLMKTAEMSNRRLGRESDLDPSYISRLRRGKRIPRYHSPYLVQICKSLLDKIINLGKLSDLSLLTSLSEAELTKSDSADGLRRWLFGYGSFTGYLAADELLDAIASIDEWLKDAHKKTPPKHDIENLLRESQTKEDSSRHSDELLYVGIDGIRSAVIRFLTEMIRSGEQEMLLYSDQAMDWMGGEYRQVLSVLMAELIRRDVKIRIIHTVDRSMPELISAIEWWMPLYLSGKIVSYYCLPSAGERFSHTLFIRPGAACIAGTSAIGLENRAYYSYSTDNEITGLAEEAFNSLLKNSLPLIQIQECESGLSEDEDFIQTEHVMVKAAPQQVILRRTKPPYLMFTFTHPMICRAFGSYMRYNNYLSTTGR